MFQLKQTRASVYIVHLLNWSTAESETFRHKKSTCAHGTVHVLFHINRVFNPSTVRGQRSEVGAPENVSFLISESSRCTRPNLNMTVTVTSRQIKGPTKQKVLMLTGNLMMMTSHADVTLNMFKHVFTTFYDLDLMDPNQRAWMMLSSGAEKLQGLPCCRQDF